MKIKTLTLHAVLLMSLTGGVLAETKYTYVGLNYNDAKPPYTSAMSAVGSIVFPQSLPANLANVAIGPGSQYPTSSWTFSDGIHTYTNSNAQPLAGISAGDQPRFTVSTDSAGNITNWDFAIVTPKGPHSISQSLSAIFSDDNAGEITSDQANTTCSYLDGVSCKQVLGLNPTFSPGPGKWTKEDLIPVIPNASPVPAIGVPGLISLGILLAGFFAVLMRKKKLT